MLLPVGAARRSFAGAIEFRTILARPLKPRAILAAAIVPRAVEARLVEMARALAGGPGIAPAAVVALLPRLVFTTLGAVTEILARPPRESLLAIAGGPIAEGTVAARRIGSLVAELPVGGTPGRTGIVAVTARPPFVAIIIRPLTARFERTLLAVIPCAKILPRSAIPGVALAISRVALAISRVALAIPEISAWAVIATETLRPIAKIPARAVVVPARRPAFPLAGVGLPAERLSLAVTVIPGAKPALGEFLLRPPRRPGAALATAGTALVVAGVALAAARPVTPAAGIVVFVAIAGHEWSLEYR
jgi:hypothetical protein